MKSEPKLPDPWSTVVVGADIDDGLAQHVLDGVRDGAVHLALAIDINEVIDVLGADGDHLAVGIPFQERCVVQPPPLVRCERDLPGLFVVVILPRLAE